MAMHILGELLNRGVALLRLFSQRFENNVVQVSSQSAAEFVPSGVEFRSFPCSGLGVRSCSLLSFFKASDGSTWFLWVRVANRFDNLLGELLNRGVALLRLFSQRFENNVVQVSSQSAAEFVPSGVEFRSFPCSGLGVRSCSLLSFFKASDGSTWFLWVRVANRFDNLVGSSTENAVRPPTGKKQVENHAE